MVGILPDDSDPMVSVMKVDKAPLESYADIGGLESQVHCATSCSFIVRTVIDIFYFFLCLYNCTDSGDQGGC